MKIKQYLNQHKRIKQFLQYWLGGGLWFCVGYGTFALVYAFSGLGWLPSKIIGDVAGWVANFFVQRYVAFNDPALSEHNVQLSLRYFTSLMMHVVVDYLIVGELYYLGVTPYLGSIIAAGFLTIWNYVWYRFWVFRLKPESRISPRLVTK
ncbi:MAG: GtrA family protein [Candidatus Saccharimonadales bacterium]